MYAEITEISFTNVPATAVADDHFNREFLALLQLLSMIADCSPDIYHLLVIFFLNFLRLSGIEDASELRRNIVDITIYAAQRSPHAGECSMLSFWRMSAEVDEQSHATFAALGTVFLLSRGLNAR